MNYKEMRLHLLQFPVLNEHYITLLYLACGSEFMNNEGNGNLHLLENSRSIVKKKYRNKKMIDGASW